MKKAELERRLTAAERRLTAAENTLKVIIDICDRSGEDIIKPFNEDSLKLIGKAIYNQDNVYPLKTGMIAAEAKFYFSELA